METHHIDYVVHALTEEDKHTQSTFFEIPRKMNRFIELDYNKGVSTTKIIDEHYNSKHDSKKLHVDIIPISRTRYISELLETRIGLSPTNTILEIGCEDPLFGRYVGKDNYMCVDTNILKVTRFNSATPYIALHLPLECNMFKNNLFDYTIINLTSFIDIHELLSQAERVSNTCVYICNIVDDDNSGISKQLFIERGYILVEHNCIGCVGYDAFNSNMCDLQTII